jgi:hypothetical protein
MANGLYVSPLVVRLGEHWRSLEGHLERSTLVQRAFAVSRYKVWNQAQILQIENTLYTINTRKRSACLNSPVSQPSLGNRPVVSSGQ